MHDKCDLFHIMFYIILFQASKNDHFCQSFPQHETMVSIMSILCSDSFSRLPHETLQLQYFEIMVRYERYFSLVPEHLLNVMVRLLYFSCYLPRLTLLFNAV